MLARLLSFLVVSFLVTHSYAGQFSAVYIDPSNKLLWSRGLPGIYSHGCVDSSGHYDPNKCTFEIRPNGEHLVKVDDSDAAIACKKIGARLPTQEEFSSLIKNFDHKVKGPSLTRKGFVEMQNVFRDMGQDISFWASDVIGGDTSMTFQAFGQYVFNYYLGPGFMGVDRYLKGSVRCVVSQ